ncbi:PHP domain-containing protein [Halovivax gelatinilyticus]|uniref:PHP domain-containing protein n=1 Tax=Halovivax gelatinilyticus TaxID=2961597 RepID=UPI0020CA5BD5|nr:PHP-associated domain-containing protein [Halovivax gelatinilyticus]
MYHVDLHAHTRFFHGRKGLGDRFDPLGHRLLLATAGRRGLDGVATTNHDYFTRFDSTTPVTIPGIEISTDRGHVLVVGPNPPEATEPGTLTPAEAVELAHERDCAAIVAHPFRNSTVREAADVPFDAVEVNGKHPRSRPLVEAVADQLDLPLIGGSDAHFPVEVGRAYTRIDADELTPESVVDAIRDGRVDFEVANGLIDRGIRRLYRSVHRKKGTIGALDGDVGPTPGVGTPSGEEAADSKSDGEDVRDERERTR